MSITATTSEFSDLDWFMLPAGTGSLAPGDQPLSVVYTAPATVAAATTVTIVASGFDGSVGAALTTLQVNPAS